MINSEDFEELIILIKGVHSFDFSGYSEASLKRQIIKFLQAQKLTLFELRTLLTNEEHYFEFFITKVTVNVTELFRDPPFYKSVQENLLPYLATYQRIKLWNAGCSTGEELYSFAILLAEQNLYDRSFLYGTDINAEVLEVAKSGIYSLSKMKHYSENYTASGAPNSLAKYYTAKYDAASIHHSLKKNVLFSTHNLVSDGVFNEFQVISCRNVLIYFTADLQTKVISLFHQSLANFGFLCLGAKETIRDKDLKGHFKVIDKKNNIYQKIN